ncbi:MAG: putative O-acetyltransferase [Frankiales bacterium]|nr:putative O-acetyltransferase [Frankiales bacterium]
MPVATSSGRTRLLGHAPALDGLRGIAVALIVVFHFAGHYVLHGATIGLDVFFALSGFLITALLLDEVRVAGRVDLRRFYARRAARLLPALALMLGAWTVLLLLFHDQSWMGAVPASNGSGHPIPVAGALKNVAAALLYVANWDVIAGGTDAPLQHLWSLSVEEQFYILWPAALLVLMTLRTHGRRLVLGSVIAASVLWSAWLWQAGFSSNRLYFGTDTRAASLLIGAFAALVWHRRKAIGATAPFAVGRAWLGVAAFVAIMLSLQENEWKYVVVPSVVALCTVQVIAHVTDSPGSVLTRGLSVRWLTWLGRRSYALYLWHYLWATWTHPLTPLVGIPLGVAGSLLCTVVSWRLVEAPALRWVAARQRRQPLVSRA